jgi:SNF2 family DNA or RNA helicase
MILSRATQHVLLPLDGRLAAMWPALKTLDHNGQKLALVPHTPAEQIALKLAGYKVPEPILSYYDFEGRTPFQAQKATAAHLSSNRRAYVLSDLGTGKTRAALWAWKYLNKEGCAGKLLVVAPLSTLKFTWQAEAWQALPDVKTVVLHSSSGKQARLKALATPDAEIFIINHDGLRTIEHEIWERRDIDTLVLDELAVYRNNSLRSKRMQKFAQRFNWVWGMTGRPCPNSPVDVWHQCKIITPNTVPKHWSWARNTLMHQVNPWLWVPKPDAIERACGWMSPHIRFTLDDVAELPEAVIRTVDAEMGKEQAKAYTRFARELAIMVKNKQVTAANAGIEMGKLLQIACGYVYDVKGDVIKFDENPRQELLLELIEEAPHKVLIFAPWRHLLKGLSELLTNQKEPIDHAVIHGGVNAGERNEIFEAFQSTSRYHCLLAHPATLAHGLTLTAATTCIWVSPVTSLEQWEQANARIRRPSQKHKQLYLCLQGSPMERRVYSMLRGKQRVQDEFLSLLRNGMKADEE